MVNRNKGNGNMYPGYDTWNPLIGECPHKCSYCSTNKFFYPFLKKRYSGPPRLDKKALIDNLGTGNKIFVCAQHDLFAEKIDPKWAIDIIEHCAIFKNTYLFQTKNPKGFDGLGVWFIDIEDYIICTTIESNRWYPEIMGNTPNPNQRAKDFSKIPSDYVKKQITIEPIMDFDLEPLINLIRKCNPYQVNIGADSGNNHLPEPPAYKIHDLIIFLESFTKVVQKSNLVRLLK
jgi:hypothetical protein